MKLPNKHKWMVRFLYGICIDTWPRNKRGHKIQTAIQFCKNNPQWEAYHARVTNQQEMRTTK